MAALVLWSSVGAALGWLTAIGFRDPREHRPLSMAVGVLGAWLGGWWIGPWLQRLNSASTALDPHALRAAMLGALLMIFIARLLGRRSGR